MPKGNTEWKVLPHGPLERVSEHVWKVEGLLPQLELRRVMTVIQCADGNLLIHNAIAVDDACLEAICALGDVTTMIVPSGYHRIDARVFHERFPKARVLCPRGAKRLVEEVVETDGSYEDFGGDGRVSLETLDGTRGAEGVVIVREPNEKTVLVFNDAVFNMPHQGGFKGLIYKYVTGSSGGPQTSRLGRMFIIRDKPAFAAHLLRLASLPSIEAIIVAHHEVITKDAAGALKTIAASLAPAAVLSDRSG